MYAYYYFITRYIPEIAGMPVFILSALGGFALLALFGSISSIVQTISDKAVIARALKGKPFRNGKRAAALGRIEPSGLAQLTAPFSGNDCLAYEYEVYEIVDVPGRGRNTRKDLHCSGYGMVPSVIRTSTQGDVRLLGFPLLDEWTKNYMEDSAER